MCSSDLDGGTRTASITGAMVALTDAVNHMIEKKMLKESPIVNQIAAISVGVYKGTPVMDLDYIEDSDCDTDMNIIMNDKGGFIEVQGTAEGEAFSHDDLITMTSLAKQAIEQLFEHQNNA